mmetsp:Transcript_7938/g.26601  ORF Transcript_7938/g.26601 Transcript_7938/m.26601 type:complete len:387 (-) Transcript_7938:254-1414(-)
MLLDLLLPLLLHKMHGCSLLLPLRRLFPGSLQMLLQVGFLLLLYLPSLLRNLLLRTSLRPPHKLGALLLILLLFLLLLLFHLPLHVPQLLLSLVLLLMVLPLLLLELLPRPRLLSIDTLNFGDLLLLLGADTLLLSTGKSLAPNCRHKSRYRFLLLLLFAFLLPRLLPLRMELLFHPASRLHLLLALLLLLFSSFFPLPPLLHFLLQNVFTLSLRVFSHLPLQELFMTLLILLHVADMALQRLPLRLLHLLLLARVCLLLPLRCFLESLQLVLVAVNLPLMPCRCLTLQVSLKRKSPLELLLALIGVQRWGARPSLASPSTRTHLSCQIPETIQRLLCCFKIPRNTLAGMVSSLSILPATVPLRIFGGRFNIHGRLFQRLRAIAGA